MLLLIKLHGTSGSGKTTIARALMKMDPQPRTMLARSNRKPEAYEVHLPNCKDLLYILGPYTATCGGLDSLSDATDHIRLLEHYGAIGHVFYEGLLGSEYYGRIGKVSEQYGDRHIFAFLDTPLAVCLDRVQARRLAIGNTKPFNTANTVGRVAKIARLRQRLETEFHRPTIDIRNQDGANQLYNLYLTADQAGSAGISEILDERTGADSP
jgi:predicted kinase